MSPIAKRTRELIWHDREMIKSERNMDRIREFAKRAETIEQMQFVGHLIGAELARPWLELGMQIRMMK